MNGFKKVISLISLILCFAFIFTLNGFALENINFSGEIDILCDYVDGEILIVTSDSGNDETINALDDEYNFISYSQLLSGTKPNGYVRSIYKAEITSSEDIASLCYDIRRESGVISAEPNYIGSLQDGGTGDNTPVSASSANTWYLNKMGNDEMQRYLSENNIQPRTVKIAVLDSGADYDNEAIRDNITSFTVDGNTYHGYNTIDDNTVGYDITDDIGHGTFIISTIVSKSFGDMNVGINPYVEILPIKVLSTTQTRLDSGGAPTDDSSAMLSSLIRGLKVVAGNNKLVDDVDIISVSMSFTVGQDTSQDEINCLKQAVDMVEQENILFVASAGNRGSYIYDACNEKAYGNGQSDVIEYDIVNYPAAYDSVIGVMGYDNTGNLWGGSDYGLAKNRTPNDVLGYDIIAPSQNVLGLSYSGIDSMFYYSYDEGTSYAAPLAAGAIAYYLALIPESHFNGMSQSDKKSDVLSVFSNKEYSKHIVCRNSGCENDIDLTLSIPTANLIDVIKAIDSTYQISTTGSDALSFTFSNNADNTKSLTINCGANEMPDFTSMYNTPWYCDDIKNVKTVTVTGSNLTKIGDYAFSGFVSLESIILPKSVHEIGNAAFLNCIKLTSVKSPGSETENSIDAFPFITEIGDCAFSYCQMLTTVDLNSLNSLGTFAFENCYRLESVDFPQSGLTLSEGAFMGCFGLRNIDLSYCRDIKEYAFFNNRATQIIFPSVYECAIGEFAFAISWSLSCDIVLKSNITSVGDCAFFYSEISRMLVLNPGMQIGEKIFAHLKRTDSVIVYGYINSTAQSYVENTDETFVSFAGLPDISAVENSTCIIDKENKIIYGLQTRLSISGLSRYINVTGGTGSYEVVATGAAQRFVGTGYTVNLKLPDDTVTETYTIVIFGDVDGDGRVDADDIYTIQSALSGNTELVDAYYIAGDVVDYGNGINQDDVDYLTLVVTGYEELSQVPGGN